MSYPIAPPDRRLLDRRRCAEPCVVEFGGGVRAAGVLRQLDIHGARVRLLQRDVQHTGDIRITLESGAEVIGATAWRIGDVVGVRRQGRLPARREGSVTR